VAFENISRSLIEQPSMCQLSTCYLPSQLETKLSNEQTGIDLYNLIISLYDSPKKSKKVIASVLNAIIVESKPVFIASANLLQALIDKDPSLLCDEIVLENNSSQLYKEFTAMFIKDFKIGKIIEKSTRIKGQNNDEMGGLCAIIEIIDENLLQLLGENATKKEIRKRRKICRKFRSSKLKGKKQESKPEISTEDSIEKSTEDSNRPLDHKRKRQLDNQTNNRGSEKKNNSISCGQVVWSKDISKKIEVFLYSWFDSYESGEKFHSSNRINRFKELCSWFNKENIPIEYLSYFYHLVPWLLTDAKCKNYSKLLKWKYMVLLDLERVMKDDLKIRKLTLKPKINKYIGSTDNFEDTINNLKNKGQFRSYFNYLWFAGYSYKDVTSLFTDKITAKLSSVSELSQSTIYKYLEMEYMPFDDYKKAVS